ncbi:hypothetical protein [Bergeyella sp. RCAD1439]|uniref:hypothetical protein n=1 Tax=Bergeyella anatis TaxID=3113737 RepID=UPI002E16FC06|nr:hypothetical protein [Bergeyella sp. RCAD1439]
MSDDFRGQRLLVVAVRFFDYEQAVVRRLRERGAEVDFYDDRPSNSVVVKGLIRFDRRLLHWQIRRYYRRLLARVKTKNYDYFLLIKGEAVPQWFLKEIRTLNPGMVCIGYTFDSVSEHGYFKTIGKAMDRVFTFDRADALRENWGFRPLFFLEDYRRAGSVVAERKWDVVMVGTAHTDRYRVGEAVKSAAERLALRSFFYYYAPGKFYFRLRRWFDRNLSAFDLKKLSFQKLAHGQILELYAQTCAVLDINKPYQNGLTMRTFEVLAASRKLLTFNADVVNYPFYSPQNIKVLDRENPVLDRSFFTTPFEPIPEEALHYMTLDAWLDALFFEDQQTYWEQKRQP